MSGAEVTRGRAVVDGKPGLGDPCFSLYDDPDPGVDTAGYAEGVNRADMSATMSALMSARFPVILPSRMVRRCIGGKIKPTYVVDGGYIENSGLLTLLQIWEKIEPLVVRFNAFHATEQVVPIFRSWTITISRPQRPHSETHLRRNPPGQRVLKREIHLWDNGLEPGGQ